MKVVYESANLNPRPDLSGRGFDLRPVFELQHKRRLAITLEMCVLAVKGTVNGG